MDKEADEREREDAGKPEDNEAKLAEDLDLSDEQVDQIKGGEEV
jgi:hypothetical protein